MASNTARALGSRTNRNMLMLALLLGLLSAILAYVYLNNQKETVAPAETTVVTKPVVVAKRDISARTIITADMLEVRQIAADAVHPNAFTNITTVVGQAARFPIAKGEQVLTNKVALSSVLAQEGGRGIDTTLPLSYVIPAGKRAMAIQVDPVVTAGGLILPGDFVDVIGVFDVEVFVGGDPENRQMLNRYLVMTVLQNVEVLAVDQEVEEISLETPSAEGEGEGAAQRVALPQGEAQPKAVTVTLAVTPEQAQILAKAAEKGSLRLALRPFGEDGEISVPPLTDVEFLPPTFPLPFKQQQQ